MTYYEIKKIFVRRSSKFSLLILAGLMMFAVYCMVGDSSWINEEGNTETGMSAIKKMKEAKQEWAGMLTEEKIRQVIEENNRINQTPEGRSDDPKEYNIAYGRKQGFVDILYIMGFAFGSFQEWNYTAADSLTAEQASEFYPNRVIKLKEWLEEGGKDYFTDKEKRFLTEQYEKLDTPFFYEYQEGWKKFFTMSPTIIMIITLVAGFLCAGIFADEYRLKASAVLYASYHGRKKAIRAKLMAGFLIVTVIYWVVMPVYSGIVFSVYGTGGMTCPIQSNYGSWKSFYNITNGQEYLLIMAGGYIGCLFMTALVMLVSAAAKSSVLAVITPFVLIFLPSFLSGINHPLMNKILGLLPDQLLQMNLVVKYFNVYEIGGRIIGAAPILTVVYPVLAAVLFPVIYRCCKKQQVTG